MAEPTSETPESGEPNGDAASSDAKNSATIDVCVQGDFATIYISPAGSDMRELLGGDMQQHKHYEFRDIGVDELAGKVGEQIGLLAPEKEDCGNGVVKMSSEVFMSSPLYEAVEKVDGSLNPKK